ncbi:glycoside hydrolase family 15 protein [Brachybacterium huguangmaarense]
MTDPAPQQAPIEDHALLSDQRTAALVTRGGTVDFLCMPRFDSPGLMLSLLGDADNGHWDLAVAGGEVAERRYLDGTLVLETLWRGPEGEATVTDFLAIAPEPSAGSGTDPHADPSRLVRLVRCTAGSVEIEQCLRIRFDDGATVPWMQSGPDLDDEAVLTAIAGADAISLHGPPLAPEEFSHVGSHRLTVGQETGWVLSWHRSWTPVPPPPPHDELLGSTLAQWRAWLGEVEIGEAYSDEVERSLLVLRGLTHRASGGIVAAATTSLPEEIGGVRTWDYRFCWLRDAALSLEALLAHGHTDAATAWRDWLLRAIAGDPENLQIMYTVTGERYIAERELPHLAGYAGSRPVRVGNGAATQFQGDVVGEVMLALSMLRDHGVEEDRWSWPLQRQLLAFACRHIDDRDQGLWEMRGEPQHFTHSRVMVWAAFDRGIDAVDSHGLDVDDDLLAQWRENRERLRAEILEHGVGPDGAFTQVYGGTEVDASLLQIPRTGFCAPDDEHMLATVRRIEEDLVDDAGFVLRYRTDGPDGNGSDGLPGTEHPFLVCGFWLVIQYAGMGREDDARALLDRLLGAGNDLHLFSEEYDSERRSMAGNFPQAFSHLGLIQAVDALAGRTR